MTSAVESEPDLKFPAAVGGRSTGAARRFTGPVWPGEYDSVDDNSVRGGSHAHAHARTHM